LRFYQTLMEVDRELRFANQARLRDLKRAHGRDITIFCSHDEKELEAMQRISSSRPPERRPARPEPSLSEVPVTA